jgi:hemerythrin
MPPRATTPAPAAAPTNGDDNDPLPMTPVPPVANGPELISWDAAKMTTGVESVDCQHRELIRHINNLHAACIAGTAKEELITMVQFLGEYAQEHFAHEEGLMQEHRCPMRGQNKAAHAQFLKDYGKLAELVQREGASTTLVIQLKEMLGNWLKNHICKVDTSLRQTAAATHPL